MLGGLDSSLKLPELVKKCTFKKATPIFLKLSLLPQLSSFDLETVSNPEILFSKVNR